MVVKWVQPPQSRDARSDSIPGRRIHLAADAQGAAFHQLLEELVTQWEIVPTLRTKLVNQSVSAAVAVNGAPSLSNAESLGNQECHALGWPSRVCTEITEQ